MIIDNLLIEELKNIKRPGADFAEEAHSEIIRLHKTFFLFITQKANEEKIMEHFNRIQYLLSEFKKTQGDKK